MAFVAAQFEIYKFVPTTISKSLLVITPTLIEPVESSCQPSAVHYIESLWDSELSLVAEVRFTMNWYSSL